MDIKDLSEEDIDWIARKVARIVNTPKAREVEEKGMTKDELLDDLSKGGPIRKSIFTK